MDAPQPSDANMRAGTFGGLLFVLVLQLDEVLKTVVLAGVGAAVSFCVSLVLRWVVRKVRRRETSDVKREM